MLRISRSYTKAVRMLTVFVHIFCTLHRWLVKVGDVLFAHAARINILNNVQSCTKLHQNPI